MFVNALMLPDEVPFRIGCEHSTYTHPQRWQRGFNGLADGTLSNVKPVDNRVLEYRLEFGPATAFALEVNGELLVILLASGAKQRQQEDIRQAKASWTDYGRRNGW